jgi:hypothetical protein
MDHFNSIVAWLMGYSSILIGLGGLSVLILVFSIAGMGWFIAQIPEDYFTYDKRRGKHWNKYSSKARIAIIIFKNIFGGIMLVGGLFLLVLPGQGLLTMVIGLFLIDYPGKFQLEQKIISIPSIFRSLNWFRAKARKPNLLHPRKQ